MAAQTLIGLVFGLLVLLGVLRVLRAVDRSYRHGPRFRAELLDQIRPLRLHRMLRHRGVDLARYLRLERVLDIRRNIRNCRLCEELERCDEVLEGRGPVETDFEFCPNCEYLARIRARQRADAAPETS